MRPLRTRLIFRSTQRRLAVILGFGLLCLSIPTLVLASWSTPLVIGQLGEHGSLRVVNGHPAVSYAYSVVGLAYTRATDPNGTAWSEPLTIVEGYVGDHRTSLAIVNGNPAISYWGNYDLFYIRANDLNGTTWGTPIPLDTEVNSGEYSTLLVVNGYPAISYHDGTNADLKYVRALDENGTTWGNPITVHGLTSGGIGAYASMAIIDGHPAISYQGYDPATFSRVLTYIRANDPNGTEWGTPIIVDPTDHSGYDTSLVVVNGRPAISYFNEATDDLKYVRALDATGSTWGTPIDVETEGIVGYGNVLQVINGEPAVLYEDVTESDLEFVRAACGASPDVNLAGGINIVDVQLVSAAFGGTVPTYDLDCSNGVDVQDVILVALAWAS